MWNCLVLIFRKRTYGSPLTSPKRTYGSPLTSPKRTYGSPLTSPFKKEGVVGGVLVAPYIVY
jgi:hypothetical protein